MSNTRLTRKVTVEGSKKITDTSAPRKSVFDRLGPGALERSQSKRDDHSESVVEKCRHWQKEGRCPFGTKCRYDHGSTSEAKPKLKIIRSIVSKNDEAGEKNNVVRVKRIHSPEDDSSDHSPKMPTKRMKPENVKVNKESLRAESKGFKEHRREQEEPKFVEKRKEIAVRRSTSSSGWNLHDNSESEDDNERKQLDWEVRGAIHAAREVALEERRNDLRRQIAKIDERDQPVVTISNMPLADDSSPPFQEDELKPEKKKKSKSEKSKKKLKKKSHKNEGHREGFVAESEYGEKPKKSKSSSGKKKKKHSNDSDHELMPTEIPYRKGEFESEVFQSDYHGVKKRSDQFHSPVHMEQVGKSKQSSDSIRGKNLDCFQLETHHYERRSRSPPVQNQVRPSGFERERHSPQFQRGQQYERQPRQIPMSRETRQLEKEERQFERETRHLQRERQAQIENVPRQSGRESHHLDRRSRKAHYEKESRQVDTEREPQQLEKASRQHHFEQELRPQPYERESRPNHSDKETRSSYYERASRSPPRRSGLSSLEDENCSAAQEWESRSSHMEAHSPVMGKRQRQQHIVERPRSEEQIPRGDDQIREKQKVSQIEGHHKEDRVRKKQTSQRSTSREKQAVEKKEYVRQDRKSNLKTGDNLREEVKQRAKKTEKSKVEIPLPVLQEQGQIKTQKSKPGQEVKKNKGPRTPSPEFKQLPLSLDMDLDTSSEVFQRQEKKGVRPKSSRTSVPRDVKPSKKDKPVARQQESESVSESSDSDSSSSSGESESDEVVNEVKDESVRSQHIEHDAKKKSESVPKEHKREQVQEKKIAVSRSYSSHTERSTVGNKDRKNEDVKNLSGERDHHPDDRKERPSNIERREEERYYREHARDHRRPRDEDGERRMDNRGSKDIRDTRDYRDYREYPRMDYRDPRERERFREFDERDRHLFDVRREYRDGPEFRGSWSRDMRGRDGYDGYDGRSIPGEYERHYERDRQHIERGGRFREVDDRHEGAWHERRGERGYRESERYHEERERHQDDRKTSSRNKRSRTTPEPSRGKRKGHHGERKRGSGTPPEESEEWDYEEGNSPEVKEQHTSSRKRGKESPSRSPRSDSFKRKKLSTPESQNTGEKSQYVDNTNERTKDDDKDSKKLKKEKEKCKKMKKRKSSEEDTGTAEASPATPERAGETSHNEESKTTKDDRQAETTKKSDTEESDSKPQKYDMGNVKETEMTNVKTEVKSSEQAFSDWSDASEGTSLDKVHGSPSTEKASKKMKEVKVKNSDNKADDDSYEHVYDPISDDELEAIIADEKPESKAKENRQTLDIEDVDWSILERKSGTESEPGDYTKRFSGGNIFSSIGISSALAGPILAKTVQDKCSQDVSDKTKHLFLASRLRKLTIGALVSAETRKLKERASVVNDIGPCRRALCARRDFHIRKQLRRLTSTKLGMKLLLDNTAVEPMDSGMFANSVSIFKRGMTAPSAIVTQTSQELVC